MTLLYGIVAVAFVWWLSNKFVGANTAAMAKAAKIVGGVLALGAAALLGVRGRFDMAFMLAGVAAWLLGWSSFALPNFFRGSRKTPGSVSRVRSAMIEMELDHDTGAMDGSVLAGTLVGRRLASLDKAALSQLYERMRDNRPRRGPPPRGLS